VGALGTIGAIVIGVIAFIVNVAIVVFRYIVCFCTNRFDYFNNNNWSRILGIWKGKE
jgi:hypothetical protein